MAMRRSPRVRAAQAAVEVARAFRTFGALPRVGNPVVNVRAMIGKPDDPAATYALLFGLPIDIGGRRPAYRSEARHYLGEAEAQLAAARNDVRAQVAEAYVQTLFAAASHAVAEESALTARELLLSVQARLAAGAVTALDQSLAAAQAAQSSALLEQARRQMIRAQFAFRRVLDLTPEDSVELAQLPAPELPEWLTREVAIARALHTRHETKAWARSRDRLRASAKRLRAEAVAPLLVAFESERQGNHQTNSTVGASVGSELPLVLKNQGERAVASAQAQGAELERELSEHEIARQVAEAFDLFARTRAEVSALEERALPEGRRTLSMVRALLDSGAVDYLQLLTARNQVFSLRQQHVDAMREAWLQRAALEHATGGWERLP